MEALDQLYINGWAGNVFSSAQAARNLIDLATGATLGALRGLGGNDRRRTACGRAPGIHLEPAGQVVWHRMRMCTSKLVALVAQCVALLLLLTKAALVLLPPPLQASWAAWRRW